MKPTFDIEKKKRDEMIGLIQKYYEVEQGEPIGNIKAMLLLDFFIENLAPKFYNIGVEDAHAYLSTKMEDIFEIQK